MNPKEHCKAVTLRSRRTLQELKKKSKNRRKKLLEIMTFKKRKKRSKLRKAKKREEKKKKKLPEPYQPPLPFSQRFQKAKLDKRFGKFLEVLQKLCINIPFTEALSLMPSYTKFLKEILSKKRRLEDYEIVALTKEYRTILQNKLPLKLKDPRSFFIPCLIGNMNINKALCDLGASVSLMPLSHISKAECGRAETNYHLLAINR
ncbi:uncharacterized protein LOC131172964 [Hevea brasiliensis]|uniref:uncharacterized protein LOC131172964 n=1 Tax=Hevea brasiliensis TaxID=3981 RepID=UPI0025DC6EAB|nr:uncharacterized protein LOC131172964 [Hevea brasiliensis]